MLETGIKAPRFTLYDQTGNPVFPSDYLGQKSCYALIKELYAGLHPLGCAFDGLYREFQQRSAAVTGVSRDSSASRLRFAAKHGPCHSVCCPTPRVTPCKCTGCGREKTVLKVGMGVVRATFIMDEREYIKNHA